MALSGCTLSTDHHYVFPDRRRRPPGSRGQGGATDRGALPPVPRAPWTWAGPPVGFHRPGGRGTRRDPRSDRGCNRPLARPVTGVDAADRGRAVLAVHGLHRLMTEVGGTGPATGRADAHPPGRDGRRTGILPGDLRVAHPLSSRRIWVGWVRRVAQRTACTCPTRRLPGSPKLGPGSRTCPRPTPG